MFKFFNNKDKNQIQKKSHGLSFFLDYGNYSTCFNDYNFLKDGFRENPIASKAINLVADACASCKFNVVDSGNNLIENQNNPLKKILSRPNPLQSNTAFFRELVKQYLVFGNVFILTNKSFQDGEQSTTGMPSELRIKSALGMIVETNRSKIKYILSGGAKYTVDAYDNKNILHIKNDHLESDVIGFSIFNHIAVWIDIYNHGMKWNNSILKNDGKVSYILSAKADSIIDAEQQEQIKSFFSADNLGFKNAGKALFLNDVDVQKTSLTPAEMDFQELMKVAERVISYAFGVPHPLISPDASTFANMAEAKQMLWTDSVMPLIEYIVDEINNFLAPIYNGNRIKVVYDDVMALEPTREKKVDNVVKLLTSGMITINEAREFLGYDAIDGLASELFLPNGKVPISMVNDDINTDFNNEEV